MQKIEKSLHSVLDYAERNHFIGYNKYDALDSPILNAFSFGNKWIRLVYSQVVMRSPLNIRPLLAVPKTINPKGFGLFASTYVNLYKHYKDEKYLNQAEYFLNWLIENPSPTYPKRAWGYQHPWQDVGFFAPANLPNRVVTYFVCSAFLDAFEATQDEKYLHQVEQALDFLLNDPNVIYEDETMKCLSYVPDISVDWVVMDVSALTASITSRFINLKDQQSKYSKQLEQATKLIRYVVDKQTEYGAWWYSHPPKAHSKMHDNYHTGYICDAILHFSQNTGNDEFMPAYHTGIKYYRDHLFLKDGTPKWMNNAVYPLDVHGSAQGIISFIKAAQFDPSYLEFAHTIAEWAIDHMQHPKEGYFYYQKAKFYTKPFTLMRWSNGWMARALSDLIVNVELGK